MNRIKNNQSMQQSMCRLVNNAVLRAVSGTVYHVMDEPIYTTVNRAVHWPVYWALCRANL